MFATALEASYHGPSTKGSRFTSRFLKQLNMGSLAFAMFVALALLSNTQGKDSGPGKLSAARATRTEVFIDNVSCSPQTIAVPAGATVTWINHPRPGQEKTEQREAVNLNQLLARATGR